MSDFRPILYLKRFCPFCLKVRLFLLEAGLQDKVEIREFDAGSDEEAAIRSELDGKVEKISFPTAQLNPGEYSGESDGIIAELAKRHGANTDKLPVFHLYIDGVFKNMMQLFMENRKLKEEAAAASA